MTQPTTHPPRAGRRERGSAAEYQSAAMKNGWQTKTLEEVCQFSNGLWKGEKPPFANVGVIRNTNFTKEGTLDYSDIAYLDVEAKKFEKRRLQFGDIILEKSGGGPKQPVGRVALFDKDEGDFSFSNFTATLRVLDADELDFRFLHKFLYWTYASGVTEGMQSHSTGIRNLDGDAYKAIKISFPTLAEQQRIVGVLDEAFAGLATAQANAEKNLQNARALFASHLQSVFTQRGKGWVEKRLEEIGTTQTGSTPKTSDRANYGDFIPFVKPADFNTDGSLDYENDGLTKKGLSEARKVAAGSALMVCIGATIGKCGYCERDITTNQQINAVTPFKDVSNKFVYYQMLTEDFQRRVMLSSAQATLPIINKSKWSALTVVLPPKLEEQKQIVAKLDSLSEETQRLATLYERKLAVLAALKKSLLNEAFTGKL
jgi:type I restriction enzyme S subunit